MKFDVNRESRIINVERSFDASLPLVWDAWTKPEILDQWWAPKPWKAGTVEQLFEEGGFWHYYMQGPDGNDKQYCLFNYEKIQKHKFYTGSDAFCDEGRKVDDTKPIARWDVKFTEEAGATLVSMSIGFDSAEDLDTQMEMGFREGFNMCMGNLDELLPTLK